MDFVALDVETANARFSSICSIGAVRFEGGDAVDDFYQLVDPCADFSAINTSIHGIRASDVQGAPTFVEVLPSLAEFARDQVIVHHTHFDRTAVAQACEEHGLDGPGWDWLDSAKITRRAWPHLAQRGYGLANVCEMLGYEFDHHNALADARACGEVVLAASQELPEVDLVELTRGPIGPTGEQLAAMTEATPAGPLFGETIVFTGALSIPRREASVLAAQLGCQIGKSVTKGTTLLVVGDVDVALLAGHKKSSKQRRAEELIAAGQEIRLLAESDFLAFVAAES